MYVRQIGGTGVYASQSPKGDAILLNSTTDPTGDATYDAARPDEREHAEPRRHRLEGRAGRAAATCHPAGTPCLRVTMKVANLSLAAPAVAGHRLGARLADAVARAGRGRAARSTAPRARTAARTSWSTPSPTAAAPIQCWAGQSAMTADRRRLAITYPGATQLTHPGACAAVPGPNGTITIDVPLSLRQPRRRASRRSARSSTASRRAR